MKPLNPIVAACPPSGIRRFFDIAATMDNVISLGVGEPDYVTPWHVREAGIYALEQGYTTYTSNAGLLELRTAIVDDLARRFCVTFDAVSECLITAGVSQGLDLVMRTLLDTGDEVIIPEPCYVAYGPCVTFAGGTPVYVPSSPSFEILIDEIERAITPRTKAILVSSPSNPTGAIQPRAVLEALADLAERHDLYLVSDEIYERLSYDAPHTCMASVAPSRSIILGGFSKAHAMTGWRVGFVCAPAFILELAGRIHQYTMLCAPHVSQAAALEGLRSGDGQVADMVADYDRRRRLFVKGLNSIGLTCHEPQGAFYAFPSIRSTGLDSETFAERLLQAERVAVVPGSVFGPGGEGHVRCSYATALPLLEEAVKRMGRFVDSL
ncbi:aminotransferase class I/II-fold pyridoxal phosphate-dependent enzyme [Dactylosporangium sp. CA-139114]|uniref:aminotransferase class I/II-fold pyridoxal phosphate-dependent enzyme n=1 Tax=Dactylosporangium sp. CA-139114 TaxID=3239931 RepID=UPI003D95AF44